ncbi:hypothetical protein AAG570_009515, partial [Ranatra chinensis]
LWTYCIDLWGTARKSNIYRIQSCQYKTLRANLDAPRYVSNHTLQTDLNIPTVREVLHEKFKSFHSELKTHIYARVSSPSSSTRPLNPPRRLKRRWPRDILEV